MVTSVSTAGIQQLLAAQLANQQTNLSQLNEELGTGQQYSNLTDYAPTDARNLMDFQNAITQRQAYLSSITTVQNRLTMYNTTMSDIENIATQAGNLASSNPTLDANTASDINASAQSYLAQMADDLNQQVGGRYIYAGTRYATPPVADLTQLAATPPSNFTPVTANSLPPYDTDATSSFTVNSTPSGDFQVGNVSIAWSDLASGSVTSVDVGGSPQAVTVTGLSAGGTPADLAANLAATINQIASQVPAASGIGSMTATSSGAEASFNFGWASGQAVTPDSGGANGETTWVGFGGADGTTTQTASASSAAYTQDSVTVDNGFSVQYGVTSTAAGFQQVIAGLQLMSAATQTGVSAATYKTDMNQASILLSQGLTNVQTLNAAVANNISLLTNETSVQNTDITNLQNQLSNIQSVNLTTVGTEINLLQTQLQASYSATASLEQLSIVKYL